MKKLLSLLLCTVALFACLIVNVSASTYTEDEVIANIASTEAKTKDLLTKLKSWSDSYSSTLKSVLTVDVLEQMTSNHEANINAIVSKLQSNGYSDAANALASIKNDVLESIDALNATFKMTEIYLGENVGGGVEGSLDLFIQIRKTAKELKQPLNNLVGIYYNAAYNELLDLADNATLEDIDALLNEIDNQAETIDKLLAKLEEKMFVWQGIYNDYYLGDYEDLITGYLQDYYARFQEDYNKLYTKLETRLQNKLDKEIQEIINNADYETTMGLIAANDKLIELATLIEEVTTEVYSLASTLGEEIQVESVLEISQEYLQQIIDRLEEARDYVLSYIVTDVVVKDEEKTPYITIDRQNGIIIYDNIELNADEVLSKLSALYGDLGFAYIYEENDLFNIGTKSVIYAFKDLMVLKEYLVVVRGDIAPTGTFDITDVVKLCNQLFETEELDQYQLLAADLDGNSKIDITDVVKLCNILFG